MCLSSGPCCCTGQKWQPPVIPGHTARVLCIRRPSYWTDGGHIEGHRSRHFGAPHVQLGVGGRGSLSAGHRGHWCPAPQGSSGQRDSGYLQAAGSSLWRGAAYRHYDHHQGNVTTTDNFASVLFPFWSSSSCPFLSSFVPLSSPPPTHPTSMLCSLLRVSFGLINYHFLTLCFCSRCLCLS